MITENIIKYLEENEDLFNRLIEELDSWNGYLGDDRWIPMDELDEMLHHESPSDIIRMVSSDFDLNDIYFRFDGYGCLESSYYLDYTNYLDEYFVKELMDKRSHIDINDKELEYMLDELEEE